VSENVVCAWLGMTRLAKRCSAFSAELAWIVASDPAWPALKESSNVRASIPRTSPKMIRSGLQRSFPLEFGAVRRIAVHLLELDAC